MPENSNIPYHPKIYGGEECLGNQLRPKEEAGNRNNEEKLTTYEGF